MKKLIIILSLALLTACGSGLDTRNMTAENLFQQGKDYFEDNENIEAQKMFDLIKLQYPASQYADDAQYYLAEIDFKREKYILAAFNYNSLRRIYPSSEYNKQSLYMRAICYYKLSPPYERDQEYTMKAIESFIEFQGTYPNDSLSLESDFKIKEMREKLAHREFSIAELYKKLDDPKASLVYYDFVINKYDDTQYFEDSYMGKVESLLKMKRVDEAQNIIMLYDKKFPEGNYNTVMKDMYEKVKSIKE
ncbi:MAG: outer membrane protein assembly factor BamD [Candidatus Kapaibacterium sp.]